MPRFQRLSAHRMCVSSLSAKSLYAPNEKPKQKDLDSPSLFFFFVVRNDVSRFRLGIWHGRTADFCSWHLEHILDCSCLIFARGLGVQYFVCFVMRYAYYVCSSDVL